MKIDRNEKWIGSEAWSRELIIRIAGPFPFMFDLWEFARHTNGKWYLGNSYAILLYAHTCLQSRDMQVTAIRFHTVPSHRSEGPQMICKLCDGGTLQGLTFTSQALPENLTRDPERIKERRIDINFPKLSRIIAGPVYAWCLKS